MGGTRQSSSILGVPFSVSSHGPPQELHMHLRRCQNALCTSCDLPKALPLADATCSWLLSTRIPLCCFQSEYQLLAHIIDCHGKHWRCARLGCGPQHRP